jgi:hypothetical protein
MENYASLGASYFVLITKYYAYEQVKLMGEKNYVQDFGEET